MVTRRGLAVTVGVGCLGVGLGVLLSSVGAKRSPAAPEKPLRAVDPEIAPAVVEMAPSALSAPAAQSTGVATVFPREEAPVPQAPRAAGEGRREVERALADSLAMHRAEPRSSWGRRAEREFTDDLLRFAKSAQFEVVDVDCRSTTCAANVEFASARAAQKGWLAIAGGQYANNCSRDVLLDETVGRAPTDRLHASVFFDCSGAQ